MSVESAIFGAVYELLPSNDEAIQEFDSLFN